MADIESVNIKNKLRSKVVTFLCALIIFWIAAVTYITISESNLDDQKFKTLSKILTYVTGLIIGLITIIVRFLFK
jgi:hypothetical protein